MISAPLAVDRAFFTLIDSGCLLLADCFKFSSEFRALCLVLRRSLDIAIVELRRGSHGGLLLGLQGKELLLHLLASLRLLFH